MQGRVSTFITGLPGVPGLVIVLLLTSGVATLEARAEYADVVLNQTSEAGGMRPVIYPHWFHRMRFRCKVCHSEFGFEMRVGANKISMNDINDGKYCGMCHDGQIAWGLENCDLCHSGKPGLKTKIRGGHETMGPGRW